MNEGWTRAALRGAGRGAFLAGVEVQRVGEPSRRHLADVREHHEHQLDVALTGILGIIETSPFVSFQEFYESYRRRDFHFEI